jgi:hypothetical protein
MCLDCEWDEYDISKSYYPKNNECVQCQIENAWAWLLVIPIIMFLIWFKRLFDRIYGGLFVKSAANPKDILVSGLAANALKQAAIDKLRHKIVPFSSAKDVKWSSVREALMSADSLFDLRGAISDPEAFVETFAANMDADADRKRDQELEKPPANFSPATEITSADAEDITTRSSEELESAPRKLRNKFRLSGCCDRNATHLSWAAWLLVFLGLVIAMYTAGGRMREPGEYGWNPSQDGYSVKCPGQPRDCDCSSDCSASWYYYGTQDLCDCAEGRACCADERLSGVNLDDPNLYDISAVFVTLLVVLVLRFVVFVGHRYLFLNSIWFRRLEVFLALLVFVLGVVLCAMYSHWETPDETQWYDDYYSAPTTTNFSLVESGTCSSNGLSYPSSSQCSFLRATICPSCSLYTGATWAPAGCSYEEGTSEYYVDGTGSLLLRQGEGSGCNAQFKCVCVDSGSSPRCPNGQSATCCDGDGSCTDGDDDWCCDGSFYCSNDGAEYAHAMGGILCPSSSSSGSHGYDGPRDLNDEMFVALGVGCAFLGLSMIFAVGTELTFNNRLCSCHRAFFYSHAKKTAHEKLIKKYKIHYDGEKKLTRFQRLCYAMSYISYCCCCCCCSCCRRRCRAKITHFEDFDDDDGPIDASTDTPTDDGEIEYSFDDDAPTDTPIDTPIDTPTDAPKAAPANMIKRRLNNRKKTTTEHSEKGRACKKKCIQKAKCLWGISGLADPDERRKAKELLEVDARAASEKKNQSPTTLDTTDLTDTDQLEEGLATVQTTPGSTSTALDKLVQKGHAEREQRAASLSVSGTSDAGDDRSLDDNSNSCDTCSASSCGFCPSSETKDGGKVEDADEDEEADVWCEFWSNVAWDDVEPAFAALNFRTGMRILRKAAENPEVVLEHLAYTMDQKNQEATKKTMIAKIKLMMPVLHREVNAQLQLTSHHKFNLEWTDVQTLLEGMDDCFQVQEVLREPQKFAKRLVEQILLECSIADDTNENKKSSSCCMGRRARRKIARAKNSSFLLKQEDKRKHRMVQAYRAILLLSSLLTLFTYLQTLGIISKMDFPITIYDEIMKKIYRLFRFVGPVSVSVRLNVILDSR